MKTRLVLAFAAVAAVVAYVLTWGDYAGRAPLHPYGNLTVLRLGDGESALYLVVLVVQSLLILAALTAFSGRRPRLTLALRRIGDVLAEKPRRSLLLLATVAATIAMAFAIFVVEQRTIMEDEKTYLFQAKLLLSGRLSIAVPPEAAAFVQPFITVRPGVWSGQYPWAQPALLAIGLKFASPWCISPFELAVTVYFAGLLAWELSGDPKIGIASALLSASSPTLLLGASTLHNGNLSAACCTVFLWAFARLHRGPSRAASVALGVAAGVGTHARQLDAAVIGAAALVLFLAAHRRDLRAVFPRLFLAALVALPWLALHPITNYLTTGSIWHNGYWALDQMRSRNLPAFGFGDSPFTHDYSFARALTKMFSTMVRLAFYFTGTPYTLGLFVLPLLGIERMPRETFFAPMFIVFVYLFAYFLYKGGLLITMGPAYYAPIVPVVTGAVAAVAIAVYRQYSAAILPTIDPGGLFVGGAIAGALFLAAQLGELHRAADFGDRCLRAVRRHGIERGLVFVGGAASVCERSWQCWPPMADPQFEDPVLFARASTPENDARVARAFGADRPLYYSRCMDDGTFGAGPINHYDPHSQ